MTDYEDDADFDVERQRLLATKTFYASLAFMTLVFWPGTALAVTYLANNFFGLGIPLPVPPLLMSLAASLSYASMMLNGDHHTVIERSVRHEYEYQQARKGKPWRP